MKKTHRTVVFTVVTMSILSILVILSFYSMTKNGQSQSDDTPKTEVEKLVKKDIESNYPGTPREVLKLYCRITQCLYNDEMTEEQFEQLADQLRLLFDDKLLENNESESHKKNLLADITSYHDNEERISSYDVQLDSDTKYGTIKKEKYATLKISFLIQKSGSKKSLTKTYEEFLLRKSKDGRWKILNWQLTSGEDLE